MRLTTILAKAVAVLVTILLAALLSVLARATRYAHRQRQQQAQRQRQAEANIVDLRADEYTISSAPVAQQQSHGTAATAASVAPDAGRVTQGGSLNTVRSRELNIIVRRNRTKNTSTARKYR